MGVKVRALRMGYCDHVRKRAGDEWIMTDHDFYKIDPQTKKPLVDSEGNVVGPAWVEAIEFDIKSAEPTKAKRATKKGSEFSLPGVIAKVSRPGQKREKVEETQQQSSGDQEVI